MRKVIVAVLLTLVAGAVWVVFGPNILKLIDREFPVHHRSLEEACSGRPCPTFEARLAQVNARARSGARYAAKGCATQKTERPWCKQHEPDFKVCVGSFSRCTGGGHAVSESDTSGSTDYFDSSGAMIGRLVNADTGGTWVYGSSCEALPAEPICGTAKVDEVVQRAPLASLCSAQACLGYSEAVAALEARAQIPPSPAERSVIKQLGSAYRRPVGAIKDCVEGGHGVISYGESLTQDAYDTSGRLQGREVDLSDGGVLLYGELLHCSEALGKQGRMINGVLDDGPGSHESAGTP